MPQYNIKQVKGASQGSVLFLGSNGKVVENNTKLFWDSSSGALLIGTNSLFGTEKFRVFGSQRIDGDLVITGSFSVLGSASFINTQNLLVQDPIILLAATQSGAPVLDSGFFINRGTGATQGVIWDESASEFSFIQTDDGASVMGNVNITSYAKVRAGGLTVSQLKISSGASPGYVLMSTDVNGLGAWVTSSSFIGPSINTVIGGTGISVVSGLTVATVSINNTGVVAAQYGSTNSVSQVTFNLQGQVTSATSVSIVLNALSNITNFTASAITSVLAAANFTDTATIDLTANSSTVNAAIIVGSITASLLNSAGGITGATSGYVLSVGSTGSFYWVPRGAGSIVSVNGGTGISVITTAGSGNATVSIANSGVVASTYGSTNSVSSVTFNLAGQAIAATAVSIVLQSGNITNFTASAISSALASANFTDTATIDLTANSSTVNAAIIVGSITASLLNSAGGVAGATSGYVLSVGSTGSFYWIPSGGGSITSIVAGTGLTGGGSTGVVTIGASATNGLNVDAISDSVELGGPLTKNTLITAGLSNAFTMSSTGATLNIELVTQGSFHTFSHQSTSTGAFMRAITGGVPGHVQQFLVDDAKASFQVRIGTQSGLASGSVSNIIIYNSDNAVSGSDASINNRMLVTDEVYKKGLVYSNDYTSNFTNNSLITKGWVISNTVASVIAGTGISVLSGATVSINNTGVVAAQYGSTNSVSQVTFNLQGQATSATSVSIVLNALANINNFTASAITSVLAAANFTDTSTIDLTANSSTVNANIIVGSITASLLNSNGGIAGATAGYMLTVGSTGSFYWKSPLAVVLAAANFTDTSTIDLTANGSTVTAAIIVSSITSSLLMSNGGATAGYVLSVGPTGSFNWVSNAAGSITSVNGGTGISVITSSDTGSATVSIANTGIVSSTYGSTNSVSSVTFNLQGQAIAATSVSIVLNALSNITNFTASALTSIFQSTNFIDSSTVDFSLFGATAITAFIAPSSITASLLNSAGGIAGATAGYVLSVGSTGSFYWVPNTAGGITSVNGGTGISVITTAGSGNATVSIANSGVVVSTYGSTNSVPSVTFNLAGQAIAATAVSIVLNALSNINNFTASAITSVLAAANFTDTATIDLTANSSTVNAAIIVGSITASLLNSAGGIAGATAGYVLSVGSTGSFYWVPRGAGSIVSVNGGTGISVITTAGSGNATVSIANSGVVASTYGSTNSVPSVTFNLAGQAIAATAVSIVLNALSNINNFTASAITSVLAAANFTDTATIDLTANSSTVNAAIIVGSITASLLNSAGGIAGATAGYVLSVGSTGSFYWIPSGGGSITSIVAGTGLTGGGSSGAVTIGASATNGLNVDVISDSVELGGPLTKNTLITAGLSNAFTMSSNGATLNIEVVTQGSFHTFSHQSTSTGAFMRAITGGVPGHVQQFLVDDAKASFQVRIGTQSGLASGSVSNIIIYNSDNALSGSDASINNRMLVTDDVYKKGLVYSNDYTANFTNNSLITKGWVISNTVASVIAGTGIAILSGATVSINNTGVVAAQYGSTNSVSQVTFNLQGQATSATSVSIVLNALSNITNFTASAITSVLAAANFTDTATIDLTANSSTVNAAIIVGSITASLLNSAGGIAGATAGYVLSVGSTGSFYWVPRGAGSIVSVNGGTGISVITTAGSGNATVSIANSGVVASTYGSTNSVPSVTFNLAGQAIAATAVSIVLNALSNITNFTASAITSVLAAANFTDTATIDLTANGSTVTAAIIVSSITASLLNSAGGIAGATAGYVLSVGSTGSFYWVQNTAGSIVSVNGGTGISVITTAGSGNATVSIANSGVVASTYGSTNSVPSVTFNLAGQAIAATAVSIVLNALSNINNFTASALTSVFQSTNFIDSSTVDFSLFGATAVTAFIAPSSITASLLNSAGGIAGATAGYVLSVGSTGSFYWIPSGGGSITGTGTASYLTRWVSSTQIGSSNITHGGTGPVGFGTASPTHMLSIDFDSNFQDGIEVRNNSNGAGAITNGVFKNNTPASAGVAGTFIDIGILGGGNTVNATTGAPNDVFLRTHNINNFNIINFKPTAVEAATASYIFKVATGVSIAAPTSSSMMMLHKGTQSATQFSFAFGIGAANFGQTGYVANGTASGAARFRYGEFSVSGAKVNQSVPNSYGSAISSILTAAAETSGAATSTMYLDSIGATGSQVVYVPLGSGVGYRVSIVAVDGTASRSAFHILQGVVRRPANGVIALDGSTNTAVYNGFTNSSVVITADATDNSMKIAVTGITGYNIRWVARIDLVQVIAI